MGGEPAGPGCCELTFAEALAIPASPQVALEDYARALARATQAAVITHTDGAVLGVHLCGVEEVPDDAARSDLEAFARELVSRADDGLGWS